MAKITLEELKALACDETVFPVEQTLYRMAIDAIPVDDDDYSSDRQIEAMNLFVDEMKNIMTEEQVDRWDAYALKATCEESVEFAANLVWGDGNG